MWCGQLTPMLWTSYSPLKELADTFDAMLERLDGAFDAQRRFAANASHELRTPLATNRTLLEVAVAQHRVPAELREVIDAELAANAHSELVLDGLLTLARSESQAVNWLPVDLSDIAARAVEETAGEAAAAGVTVDAEPDPADLADSGNWASQASRGSKLPLAPMTGAACTGIVKAPGSGAQQRGHTSACGLE